MKFLLLLAPSFVAAAVSIHPAAKLPLTFEPNRGQFVPEVLYGGRGPGFRVALTPAGAVFASRTAEVRWTLVGANDAARATPVRRLGGVTHYLIGERTQWLRGVPNYGGVRLQAVWPGIDLEYYGNPDRLEYDFHIAPGADPAAIRLRFDRPVSLSADGALQAGAVRFEPPVAYQESGGERRQVDARFAIEDGVAHFRVGEYDRSKALVIDPVLAYSSLLGGNDVDLGNGIGADSSGNVYIAGNTDSRNFPATLRAFGGGTDVFVTKFNAAGTATVYSTFIGGSGEDRGRNLAIDTGGNVYLAGETNSTNFPVVTAFQGSFRGGVSDAFVLRLNAVGADFLYSTYLGGSGEDSGYGIRVDAVGGTYVSGVTSSGNFPVTTGALRTTYGGGELDAFVVKLNPSGAALAYGTYLGGSGLDTTDANLAIDAAGAVYATGETVSPDFPITAGAAQSAPGGGGDVFVSKLNPQGAALVYSTLLGGRAEDIGLGIAVDATGAAYVSGATLSPNFPTTLGAVQRTFGGGDYDAFVAKLDPQGRVWNYATYLGGAGFEDAWAIAVDAAGVANVIGTTSSGNFPVTADALQTTFGGGEADVFFARLNSAGSAITYGTFLGWTGFDEGFNLARDTSGNVYITGAVDAGFPTTPGALQSMYGGGDGDAFVAKVTEEIPLIGQPRFRSDEVRNAASFASGPVAPGELISIFGEDLGPATPKELKLTAGGRVDTNLGVTRVLFDGVEAPLVFVSQRQINAVVPYEVAGKQSTNIVVVNRGMRSNNAVVEVSQAAPAIFSQNSQGTGAGSILNGGLTVNSPSNPAAAGSTIAIWATGAGQLNPAVPTGSVPMGLTVQALPVTVTIGGLQAQVTYMGNAPQAVAGVLQVNATVPQLPPGNAEVVVTVGGRPSQSGVTVSVR